jgi:hypothetical protein
LLSHGAFEQALAVGGELAESADGAGGHLLNRGAESLGEHHERSTRMEIIPAPSGTLRSDRGDGSIYTEGSIGDVTYVIMSARDLRKTRPVHRRALICDAVPFLRI